MVSTGRLGPERSSACDTRLATEAKEVAGRTIAPPSVRNGPCNA